MQMTYIEVKIKIICKMGSFIHALKCTTQVLKSSKKEESRNMHENLKRVAIQNEVFFNQSLM